MGKSSSAEHPEQSHAAEKDATGEEEFIALYTELTGASET
jgi:hypothetical protein